ncbi:MAG: rhomboid family intramembrane serine protease [Chlorobi bacterium]|nr:rhomboid family intramembrane serine protease [Chlorobiota bacterium]
MSIVDEIKRSYYTGGVLTRFIYVNIGVFLFVRLSQIFFTLSGVPYPMIDWLAVPAGLSSLILKPWTIITYMFLHYELIHFIFNVLVLYWFGKLFLLFFSPRQFVGVYFLGGITGALFFILIFNLVPGLGTGAYMLGASASIMALIFSAARYRPDFTVYMMFIGPVKLKYVALVYLILDLISISAMTNVGGSLAHIGGAAFGWYFAGQIMKGKDVTTGFNNFTDKLLSLFKKKSTMKVTYKRPVSDMEYNARKVKKQAELDRILDKVKKSGYDSLTRQEKKFLFEESKN